MASSKAWQAIFDAYGIHKHDFAKAPFYITNEQIKQATSHFSAVADREVRVLCKQDSRSDRPDAFKERELFILPVNNGKYAIIRGEGYIEIPENSAPIIEYDSKLDFYLDTAIVGNSEMQHLDVAYAASIIRTFMTDTSLVLTIRGRKYTPKFNFNVGEQEINVESVQTEVDAGYEGRDKVVLVEAKSSGSTDTIIRQMFYPYRQWQASTTKELFTLFFERDIAADTYNIWQFAFQDANDYNSIHLVKHARYRLRSNPFTEKSSIDS